MFHYDIFIHINHCASFISTPTTFFSQSSPPNLFLSALPPSSFTYFSLCFHAYMYALCHIYIYDLALHIFKYRLHTQEKDGIFYLSTLHVPSSCFHPPPFPKSPFYRHVITTHDRRCTVYLSESGLC